MPGWTIAENVCQEKNGEMNTVRSEYEWSLKTSRKI